MMPGLSVISGDARERRGKMERRREFGGGREGERKMGRRMAR
jgi:hypothetical protein